MHAVFWQKNADNFFGIPLILLLPLPPYVLFWWTMYDENSGDGSLSLSIRNTANGAAISYKGDAFPKAYSTSCSSCYEAFVFDKDDIKKNTPASTYAKTALSINVNR